MLQFRFGQFLDREDGECIDSQANQCVDDSDPFPALGIYFMTYVMGDANLLGTFASFTNIPMIIGLLVAPSVIKKMNGMYKVNLVGYGFATACRVLVIVGGYLGNIPMMLIFTALCNIGMSPMQGDLNALIAACSEYTYLKTGKRIDGSMYSCTSSQWL